MAVTLTDINADLDPVARQHIYDTCPGVQRLSEKLGALFTSNAPRQEYREVEALLNAAIDAAAKELGYRAKH